MQCRTVQVGECTVRHHLWLQPRAHSNARVCRIAQPRTRLHRASASGTSGTITREVLTNKDRLKLDDSDDRQFYSIPRLVKHVDDGFLRQLTELYRQRIKPGAAVLDLMSSWVSHLPTDVAYSKVVGHGMSASELARNKQLSQFFVRNLNTSPDGWEFADQTFDAVICCVSVQYLQQPERVFAEIFRVLKPGGVCIISFSNRLFYQKAVQAWRDNSDFGRRQLVVQYFQCVDGFTQPEIVTSVALDARAQQPTLPPLLNRLAKLFERAGTDPFNAVIAYREAV